MAAHDDKAQEALRRRAEALQKAKDTRIDGFISTMLNDPGGREFAWWLLQVGKYGTQPFNPDALKMAFAAGELNVGMAIVGRLTSIDPAAYLRMQQEQLNEWNSRVVEPASREPSAAERPGAYDAPGGGPDSIE
jgi:hypothetical protein